MSITFRDYNDHSSSTYVDPTNTAGDPNAISITKATPTEMDYAISEGGVTYTIAVGGQFDLSHLTSPVITLADVNAAMTNNTLTGIVNSWVVTNKGAYVISQSYSPGLSLPVFSAFQDGNTLA